MIAWWSVSKLARVLRQKPLYIMRLYQRAIPMRKTYLIALERSPAPL